MLLWKKAEKKVKYITIYIWLQSVINDTASPAQTELPLHVVSMAFLFHSPNKLELLHVGPGPLKSPVHVAQLIACWSPFLPSVKQCSSTNSRIIP